MIEGTDNLIRFPGPPGPCYLNPFIQSRFSNPDPNSWFMFAILTVMFNGYFVVTIIESIKLNIMIDVELNCLFMYLE